MECPFCKKNINENATFCPNCGQLLENSLRYQSVDNYWDNINTQTKKEIENHKQEIYEKKKSKRKVRAKNFFKVFFVCLIILVLCYIGYILIENHNTKNENRLSHISESMIGKSYCDPESVPGYWNGGTYDVIIVELLDNENLTYTYGKYRFSTSKGLNNPTAWEKIEIYEQRNLPYKLSISFLGKVTIYINGKEYEVNIDNDDDSVSGIDLLY